MALKSQVVLELEHNDKMFRFVMPWNTPVEECHAAAQKVMQELVEFAKKVEEQRKENEEKEEGNDNAGAQ